MSLPSGSTLSRHATQYIRDVVHAQDAPPPIAARFFYTSHFAIDDPLSPLPPPLTGSSVPPRQPPRPFSTYDSSNLDKAWLELRQKLLRYNEETKGEKRLSQLSQAGAGSQSSRPQRRPIAQQNGEPSPRRELTNMSFPDAGLPIPRGRGVSGQSDAASNRADWQIGKADSTTAPAPYLSESLRKLEPTAFGDATEPTRTTGTPFIRAPSRKKLPSLARRESGQDASRPPAQALDSYNWGDHSGLEMPDGQRDAKDNPAPKSESPTAKVAVGISRLHEVVMPQLQMLPIYWSPVHDIATVTRATWFYKDSMLPVEVEAANMLEAGYIELRPWSQTWTDELNSAVEVGALGEEKIVHKLWPEKMPKKVRSPRSRPITSGGRDPAVGLRTSLDEPDDPEKEQDEVVSRACDIIDISTGVEGPDNKASGYTLYGRDGRQRKYLQAGIIYANDKDAFILRPNLQPSDYYGRRPLANYIRKGHKIGVHVVRGFDQDAWNKLHPRKKGGTAVKAFEGVSTSQAGAPPGRRRTLDAELAQAERPKVTDLVLVIHGIGQKLSERVESYHFTHAINAFRREVNVELGTESVKRHLRDDAGGIMILPVNWRLTLSFEDGGYREDGPSPNQFTLRDITPDVLPSVRNIVSDVMLDIPYYLSQEHNPKMLAAVTHEANRIYRLWCANNPGFAEYGRVHIIAHSLGSVMAVDILSKQPTHVSPSLGDPETPLNVLPKDQFFFDTKSLFVCGSPVGFFLLLKRATLLPRRDRNKPDADNFDAARVAGDQGTYGCLAIDNIYNIVNPYDPVAYRLNATVDANYSAILRPAFVPSSSDSWLRWPTNPFKSSASAAAEAVGGFRPVTPRLPSNVELETHDFSREEIAERRAFLLNDNGQIDWFLRYGGGPLEIQYLTMLGAHSSYWISRDFVRFVVVEVGREFGREGTVGAMRAVKRKVQIG